MYGKGKDDEWDTIGDMLDSSLDGGIKSEPYDTMYDDDENFSENSNMEWIQHARTTITIRKMHFHHVRQFFH